MRLIDGDALKKRVDNLDGKLYSPILFEEMVKNTSTIEAEPVKHGTWLPHKITASVICSNCRRVFPDETPRCPSCGAKMITRGDDK